MLITFDIDLCQVIPAPGFTSPLTSIAAKRGDGEDVQIQLVRDGQLWRAPGAAELKFCVKKWGDFSEDAPAYALSTGFVFVDELMRYEAAINYNTNGLMEMMLATSSAPNAVISDLMMEVAYRPSSAVTFRRSINQIRFHLHNNVIRGNETIPGAGTGTELLPTNYLTKDRVIEYLPICTGLTGGGTANLDGLATAAGVRTVNSVVSMIDNTASIDTFRIYELVSGNVAESAPTIIRPDDFHATTNPRVWRLRSARVNFDPDSYLLKSASVEWLSAVVGVTGGGATKLDGVATVARAVESVVVFVDNNSGSPVLRHYELIAGTTAEAAPNVIRPDDYHATTNAKVWALRGGAGTGAEFLTPATGVSVVGYYELDTMPTVGVAVGKLVTKLGITPYPSTTNAQQFWMLATAADATSLSQGRAADIITPPDWHATTNNKKWVQIHAGGYWQNQPMTAAAKLMGIEIFHFTSVGGSTALAFQGLPTAPATGYPTGAKPIIGVRMTNTTNVILTFYQLTTISSGATIAGDVTPNDYHATTNPRVWRKLTLG